MQIVQLNSDFFVKVSLRDVSSDTNMLARIARSAPPLARLRPALAPALRPAIAASVSISHALCDAIALVGCVAGQIHKSVQFRESFAKFAGTG